MYAQNMKYKVVFPANITYRFSENLDEGERPSKGTKAGSRNYRCPWGKYQVQILKRLLALL